MPLPPFFSVVPFHHILLQLKEMMQFYFVRENKKKLLYFTNVKNKIDKLVFHIPNPVQ